MHGDGDVGDHSVAFQGGSVGEECLPDWVDQESTVGNLGDVLDQNPSRGAFPHDDGATKGLEGTGKLFCR